MSKVMVKDLNAIYTNIVTNLLSKGYTLNPSTMEYTSSTVLDFVSNKEPDKVIRLWKLSSSERINSKYVDCINFELRKYNADCYKFYTSDGEWISNKKFYSISKKCYVTSVDEFKEVEAIRNTRLLNKKLLETQCKTDKSIDVKKVSSSFKTAIMNRITKVKGMKRAKFNVVKCIHLYHSTSCNRMICEVRWNCDDKHGTIKLR